MARKTHSRNQPYRQMPMVILNRKPGSGAHRVRKPVVLEGSASFRLRRVAIRRFEKLSSAFSGRRRTVCKPLPSFVSDFPSRGFAEPDRAFLERLLRLARGAWHSVPP
jgi:hypothetical protein